MGKLKEKFNELKNNPDVALSETTAGVLHFRLICYVNHKKIKVADY